MISKKETKHIASLARLGLNEKELSSIQKDFSSILDYIEALKEVDISSVENVRPDLDVVNRMRKDIICQTEKEKIKEIMGLVPEKKDSYFKTKKIL